MTDDALAELLTLTVEVDKFGTYYFNALGELHRVHGPATTLFSGTNRWHQNGILHRTDGPAIEWCDGDKEWLINGQGLTEREFNERIKTIR